MLPYARFLVSLTTSYSLLDPVRRPSSPPSVPAGLSLRALRNSDTAPASAPAVPPLPRSTLQTPRNLLLQLGTRVLADRNRSFPTSASGRERHTDKTSHLVEGSLRLDHIERESAPVEAHMVRWDCIHEGTELEDTPAAIADVERMRRDTFVADL